MKDDIIEVVNSVRPPNLSGTLSDALLTGEDTDEVILPGDDKRFKLGGIRELIKKSFGLTPTAFSKLPRHRQDRIAGKLRREADRAFKRKYAKQNGGGGRQDRSANMKARDMLHKSLRPWSIGPLEMERPGGSVYHHLLEYDKRVANNDTVTMEAIAAIHGEPQSIVVEHDWARSMGGELLEGEVRMPFPHTAWEFKISGVRVIAFVRVDTLTGECYMFCVYGRDDAWVADDYFYVLGGVSPKLGPGRRHDRSPVPLIEQYEFRRVAELIHANIRASCILIDAERVVQTHSVAPSPDLVRSRVRSGKTAPRTYVVIRLLKDRDRTRRASGALGSHGPRAPQRGHWRRGTWVHYDDADSGEVQYVNSGGFFVSKTWRRWHFAGDPNNIIQREYRL